jgi:5-formyltetrahydrofolate cyclo-ligase
MRTRRAEIDAPTRRLASASVCAQLAERCSGRRVHVYRAFGAELDLADLEASVRTTNGTVLLPRVEGDHLVAVEHPGDVAGDSGAFVVSGFGVAEPTGTAVEPTSIDVVVVPGLAFDRRGRRLGYGRGYYDRFLTSLAPHAVTIGVAFDLQVVDEVPHESHDVALDLVITERGPVGGASTGD